MRAQTAERQVALFAAKYTPGIAASTMAARTKLRALFPRGFELVYDNYNALVFGYSPSERASEAIVSIAAYPRWVTLFLLRGAALKDPTSVLEGSGRQVRRVTLRAAGDLDSPAVRALIAQAAAPAAAKFAAAPALSTVIKSVSAKQRPRRPPHSSRGSQAKRQTSILRRFRQIALGMKGASEGAHMGHADFRANGRIFATLHADGQWGMVKLTPEQQREFARTHPGTFAPEHGAWGRQGCTRVRLDAVDEETLGEAMTLAWQQVSHKAAARGTKVGLARR
jgi:hypothetical protein